MRSTLPLLVVVGLVGALMSMSACQTTECGPGTIDRGGECEPADLTVGTAKCGPLTVLQGDQCVPMFPPTECDPATTQPDTDPTTGVTTCIGTGGGGCSAPLACPKPADGKQTICGRIYNFVDDTPFAAAGATGAKCAPGATAGPCALKIVARNPLMSLAPITTGEVYIDDCGRYRVSDIVPPSAFGVLQFDDADPSNDGDTGFTVRTLVGFLPSPGGLAREFEAFVLKDTTIGSWNGLNPTPLYVAIFRAHGCNPSTGKCNGDRDRLANQAGVTLTAAPPATVVRYFVDGPTRQQLAPATTTATTSNGAVVANLSDRTSVGGRGGGLPNATCVWPGATGAQFPGHVLFQVFRPVDNGAQQCMQ